MCNYKNKPSQQYNINGISVCMWNINGIISGSSNCSKIEDPDFVKNVEGNDIIALVETQISPNTPITLDGYLTFRKDRPQSKNARHFGGLAVLMKKDLRDLNVKIIHQTLDYMWIKFDKTNFNMNDDIYMCIAYIPPSNSQYLARLGVDILDQIQNDIMKFSKVGQIVLTGDLNARTANNLDLIDNDNDTATLSPDYIIDKQIPPRNNFDMVLNERGKELLDMCVSSRLRILNGRTVGDTLGYFTCHKWNGSSVVDYAVVSENLLACKRICYFKVHQTLGDLSDHCCISFKIRTPVIVKSGKGEENISPLPVNFKWHEDAICKFQTAMASDEVQIQIDNFMKKTLENSENGIDAAAIAVGDIYRLAAQKSLKISRRVKNKNIKKKINKAWYDRSLFRLKSDVSKCGRKLAMDPKNSDHRRNYFMLLKLYRKSCKRKYREYRKQVIHDLDQLHDKSPKTYWELVKKLKETSVTKSDKISPSEWYSHFSRLANKNNFKTPLILNEGDSITTVNMPSFTELDFKIKESEISKAIKKLKKNKACGPDGLCNEIFKFSQHIMLPLLAKLFNHLLISGKYPTSWAEGIIKTLFKKDDPYDPNNYRGITLSNSLGKLFNSIMNSRITTFLDKYDKMNMEQISFKEGHRTADHIFVIKTILSKYKKNHRSIYACFVDFRKAYDSVSIPCLLYKLHQIGVTGHMHSVIENMYSKTKLKVDVGIGLTEEFASNIGVRQGDNLSPTLFNIFINDLPDIFEADNCSPVTLKDSQISCLMYADDLVILSESADGLQNSLNALGGYCDKWGLTVNMTKTKVIVFNPKRKEQTKFSINGTELECVKEIAYLGIILSQNGSFDSTKSTLYKKGLKSLFKLKNIITPLPKISTCLHLFNHLVKPVILYSSEVWSYSIFGERNFAKITTDSFEKLYNTRTSPIEKILIKYCKMLLHLPSKASNVAPYGELGVYPVYIDCITRTLKYWSFIETKSPNALLREALGYDKELHDKGKYTWYSFARNIKKIAGIGPCDIAPSLSEIKLIKKKLQTRYIKHWKNTIDGISEINNGKGKKLRTYKLFKIQFGEEKYLSTIKNREWKACLSKFRMSSHKLQIETGRHCNIKVEDRVCKHCNLNVIEDEKHFLMECPLYSTLREKMTEKIKSMCPNVLHLGIQDQFCWIMSSEIDEIIYALAQYTFHGMELRANHS